MTRQPFVDPAAQYRELRDEQLPEVAAGQDAGRRAAGGDGARHRDRPALPGAHSPPPAYRALGHGEGDLPVAEAAARAVLSLPIYPHMSEGAVHQVCDAIEAVA